MPEQITRLLIFFLLVLLGYFVVRPALIPDTYNLYGRYRAAALNDIRALEPAHLGRGGCAECHEEQAGLVTQSRHAAITCESCHTAGRAHAADPVAAPLHVPSEADMRQFCGLCHHERVGRPGWLPQVDIETHNEGGPCTDCHAPHEVMEW